MKLSIISNADFTDKQDMKLHGGDYWIKLAIARALEAQGVTVTDDAPDVILHMFGWPVEIETRGTFNILWIHSHPDLITPEILRQYDRVFCISPKFTQTIRSWGFEADTLMFPTDKMLCEVPVSEDMVFAGNAARSLAALRRKVVDDLFTAYGCVLPYRLKVYGKGWDGILAREYFAGESFPFDRVQELYASARITLNDHHDDMRREGFFNGRIADVLASGGFLISDRVAGVEELFEDSVPTYETPQQLKELIDRYMHDDEGRRACMEKGRRLAAQYTYERFAEKIVAACKTHTPRPIVAEQRALRVNFLLPSWNPSGGLRRVLTIADKLIERGHRVYATFPGPRPADRELSTAANIVTGYADDNLPDADILCLCFSGADADMILNRPRAKGIPFLMTLGFGAHRPVQEVLNLKKPLRVLTTTQWLADISAVFGAEVTRMGYALNFDQFFPDTSLERQALRVGMLYHTDPGKGVADGIAAFLQARREVAGLSMVIMGQGPRPAIVGFDDFEYVQAPSRDELRRLYSSCGVWLVPSWREGLGMTSLEAMACGCAVVTTDTGGSRDYAIHEQTALVSAPRDAAKLGLNLARMLTDSALRQRLSEAAFHTVRTLSWDAVIDRVERTLREAVAGKPLFRRLGRSELCRRYLDDASADEERRRWYEEKAGIVDPACYEINRKVAALHRERGELDLAREAYERVLAAIPDDAASLAALLEIDEARRQPRLAAVCMALGSASLKGGQADKARQLFEKAAAAVPERVAPLLALADLAQAQGRQDEAWQYRERALAADDVNSVYGDIYRVCLLALNDRRWPLLEQGAGVLRRIRSGEPDGWVLAAVAAMSQGRKDDAAAAVDEAARLLDMHDEYFDRAVDFYRQCYLLTGFDLAALSALAGDIDEPRVADRARRWELLSAFRKKNIAMLLDLLARMALACGRMQTVERCHALRTLLVLEPGCGIKHE